MLRTAHRTGAGATPAPASGRRRAPWAVLALLLALVGCAPLESERDAAPCVPRFPYRPTWLGADAAYSVRLSETRTLWLFGDTFGDPRAGADSPLRRSLSKLLLGNTIAVSVCGPETPWSIEYVFGAPTPEEHLRPFFDPERGPARADRFHWPLDGFLHEGDLYVALLEVSAGVRLHATLLARVANPRDHPTRWRVRYFPMSEAARVFPGFAMLARDGWLYVFASIVEGDAPRRRILSRIALAELERRTRGLGLGAGAVVPPPLAASFSTLSEDGSFRPGLFSAGARILMGDSATEMSVRYHAELDRYVAVYVPLGLVGGRRIAYRTARALTGPWSAPRTLFEIPEASPGTPAYDPDVFCYAGKEHALGAPLDPGRWLTLTYVCSSLDEAKLLHDMDLYRPVVVRRPLPQPWRRARPSALEAGPNAAAGAPRRAGSSGAGAQVPARAPDQRRVDESSSR